MFFVLSLFSYFFLFTPLFLFFIFFFFFFNDTATTEIYTLSLHDALPIAHRPGLSIARQPHHDGGRIELGELRVTEPQPFQYAGTKVLDHDVGPHRELSGQLAGARILQVQRDRLLVARLHRPPQRSALVQVAPAPQRVTAIRILDLDDLRAELGHHPRRERTGDQRAELQHFDAVKGRSHSTRLSSIAWAIVFTSVYSSSPPAGTPRARRVTLMRGSRARASSAT